MYEKTLVAFDGSETAKQALAEALRLARLTGAKVHVVRVIDAVAPFGMGLSYVPIELIDAFREDAKKQLDEARAEAKAAGVDCETEVLEIHGVTDSVAECLHRYASGLGAQLVVLGTHGRRGVKRAMLGSVAEQFVRLSDCPVLLVHG